MIARKIIITTALLLSATSAALAQSSYTTGSAADRERAGYAAPSGNNLYAYAPRYHGKGLYDYAPGYMSNRSSGAGAFATVPGAFGDPDSPAATGGGSSGYNWMVEHNY